MILSERHKRAFWEAKRLAYVNRAVKGVSVDLVKQTRELRVCAAAIRSMCKLDLEKKEAALFGELQKKEAARRRLLREPYAREGA